MAFSLEDQKIAFTLQYLQPTYCQLWMQREQEDNGTTLDWRNMIEFLLNLIKSPINRELQVTLHKLRPKVCIALSNYADFPKTQRELVELAATLEDNLRRGGAHTLSQGQTSSSMRSTQPNSPQTSTSTRASVATPLAPQSTHTPSGTCNYCHKPGHWERECRKKDYDRRNKKGPAMGVNAELPTPWGKKAVERETQISTAGQLQGTNGKWTATTVLLNCSTEVNTIDKKLAVELGLKEVPNTTLPVYTFPNLARAHSYHAYQAPLWLTDSWGREQDGDLVLYGMLDSAHPVILGLPGLKQSRVIIDCETKECR
ncbi:hypothetical protein EJ02DRAFT_483698 [Clathrospora elynae]|uniref:CCHC-type domain-containing protein n=1 Tax=Clathrospora elynae TaxID=706981 RepID=A0A6A5S7H3_9PLEO|nr:hypothetical protein EJ02DRAFT_483698 [Clathrospora elynae]